MAADGCQAAHVAAEQPRMAGAAASLWAARRARQAAARGAVQGELSTSLVRVQALESKASDPEAELVRTREVLEAAAQQVVALAGAGAAGEVGDWLAGELVGRLALEAPLLAAGAAEKQGNVASPCVPTLGKQRRRRARRNSTPSSAVLGAAFVRPQGGAAAAVDYFVVRVLVAVLFRHAALQSGGHRRCVRRPLSATAAPARRVPSARAAADVVPLRWALACRRGRSLQPGTVCALRSGSAGAATTATLAFSRCPLAKIRTQTTHWSPACPRASVATTATASAGSPAPMRLEAETGRAQGSATQPARPPCPCKGVQASWTGTFGPTLLRSSTGALTGQRMAWESSGTSVPWKAAP
ncbi:unnamed protein product [Prorocentrum cordatum]|uniref:Uncharacterized protein n=1 Tax=Prorocentrum cordatum TaxID=2364126 RepID=A0ABN9V3K1_9DINO|nr:unnamed protein product [Polarella glacialis]